MKERASERERFYISSHYYDIATRDLDKSIEIYQQWIQIYPRDTAPRDNLALRYETIGTLEKSLSQLRRGHAPRSQRRVCAFRISPTPTNASIASTKPGRWPRRQLASLLGKLHALRTGLHRGDEAAQRHVLELAAGSPEEPILIWFHARGECALGKMQSARAIYAAGGEFRPTSRLQRVQRSDSC